MAPPPSPVNGRDLSSPSTPSPEPSFRELDDAFLQNQTRIWLGEVLKIRFDNDISISDLLADGQILFAMYNLFRKLLLGEDHSSRGKFTERESVSSREITEIFPYAKVERFLEVCQSLGLSDIDLFTTSDVVDKRNTRKVCMCLRSLAKKARSRNLNVPDFDSVTHRKKSPVLMPTYMVGTRLRDLERSNSSPGPDSPDSRKGSRQSPQEEFVGSHPDNAPYKSDVSDDDCESYSVLGGGSTDYSAIDSSPRTPDPLMVKDFSSVQCELEQLNGGCPEEDEIAENECMSATESVDISSPSKCHGSGVGDNFQFVDDQSICVGDNLPNHSSIYLDWQDASSPMNNANTTGYKSYDEPELKGEDDYSNLKPADGENDTETTKDSVAIEHGCTASRGQRAVEEDKSVNSSPLPVADDADTFSSNFPIPESGKDSQFDVESEKTMQQGHGVGLSGESCRDADCVEDMKGTNDPSKPCYGKSEGLEICDEATSQHHVATDDLHFIEDDDKDERDDSKDEFKKVAQQCNSPRNVLKLVAGGTGTVAAVGILFFWFQLRKKGTANAASHDSHTNSFANPSRITATEKLSKFKTQERASTNKIYPGNKLNLG